MTDTTVKRDGDTLTVTCSARDVSKDLSYGAALRQCNSLAAEQVKSARFRVQTVAVQSEGESHLYSTVGAHWQVEGLNPSISHEFTEAVGDEFSTMLQVKYDLKGVKVTDVSAADNTPTQENDRSNLAVEPSRQESTSVVTKKTFKQSSERTLVVSSIPPCTVIFIEGQKPRAITCTNNPQRITFDPATDQSLRITAKGFQKLVKIQKDREPSAFRATESLEVSLDPL